MLEISLKTHNLCLPHCVNYPLWWFRQTVINILPWGNAGFVSLGIAFLHLVQRTMGSVVPQPVCHWKWHIAWGVHHLTSTVPGCYWVPPLELYVHTYQSSGSSTDHINLLLRSSENFLLHSLQIHTARVVHSVLQTVSLQAGKQLFIILDRLQNYDCCYLKKCANCMHVAVLCESTSTINDAIMLYFILFWRHCFGNDFQQH